MLNNNSSNNTVIACYILLSFIALHRCYIFYWLKVCGNPHWAHLSAPFFNICSRHASTSYFNISLNISNSFTIAICVTRSNLWLVIVDITTAIVLGHHMPHPCKTANLINLIYVLTAPPTRHFRISSLLFMTHYCLRHDNVEIRPINDLTRPLSVRPKGRATCHSLSIRR